MSSNLASFRSKYICSTPPQEIVDRNIVSLHLFMEVVKELGDRESEVYKNNNSSYLKDGLFQSHPSIHRGYYDYKRDGVLYVTNAETGEHIRKDQSVLLSNGTFISDKSENIVSLTARGVSTRLVNALLGDVKEIAYFKGKYFYSSEFMIHMPYGDLSQFKVAIGTDNFGAYLVQEIISAYTHLGVDIQTEIDEANPNAIFDIVRLRLEDRILALYRNSLRPILYFSNWPEHHSKLVPPNTDGSGLLSILYLFAHDGNYANDSIRSLQNRGFTGPTLYINQMNGTFGGVQWDGGVNRSYVAVTATSIRGFPFRIAFLNTVQAQVERETYAVENHRSYNNEGKLMAYTAKVTDYKVPFMMSSAKEDGGRSEKEYFDELKSQHKAAKKAYDASNKTKPSVAIDNEGRAYQVKAKPYRPPVSELPIFLGVEVELLLKSGVKMADILIEMSKGPFGNHQIVKSDSSIDHRAGNGLEIVTIPATLKYHRQMFEENFFNKPYEFHKKLMASETCGIHVHISKNSFTPLTLGKFMAFIDSPVNKDFIDAMAGRPANIYCQRPKLKGYNKFGLDESVIAVKKACLNGKLTNGLNFSRTAAPQGVDNDTFRRVSVNIQNGATVEVRIFKSAADKHNLMRKLEFCDALTRFVRSHGTQEMTAFSFVEFLLNKERKKDYPALIKWLSAKGYIDHEVYKIQGRNKLVHVYSTNKVPIPKTNFYKSKQFYDRCPQYNPINQQQGASN